MSARFIYGVHRRFRSEGEPTSTSAELEMFEGEQLADQYIEQLYRNEYKARRELEVLPPYDQWRSDDQYSDYPLFFKTSHRLWNSVPANVFAVEGHLHEGQRTTVFHDTLGADDPAAFDTGMRSLLPR